MALTTIPGGAHFPQRMSGSTVFLRNILLDAASEKIGWVFKIGKTGTIAKVGYRTGTVTTGATIDVRLETVDLTNGEPTGTLLGSNSNGAQVIADADDFVWFNTSLTTNLAVTRGDLVAVVLVNPSGSPGNLNFNAASFDTLTFPYTLHFTASWAKQGVGFQPACSLEYDDGTYAVHPGVYPLDGQFTRTFNSSSTPDERGIIFKFPFPVRVTGCWIWADVDEALDIVLYDTDGTTVLQTISLDKDLRALTSETGYKLFFDTAQLLAANTDYRLVYKPTTTTNIAIREWRVDAGTVAILDSFEGGQNFRRTERTDAGSWTDTANFSSVIGLIIDGFGGVSQLVGGGLVS